MSLTKIGFGGGCHWCTEAIFQSLRGVIKVEQGFVASIGDAESFSEAVIVHYNDSIATLKDLVLVHVLTHSSESNHQMRDKYRSAINKFSSEQGVAAQKVLGQIEDEFNTPIVTRVLPFRDFQPSDKQYHNYYLQNPQKPFCVTYITPKLQKLSDRFPDKLKTGEGTS